MKLKLALRSTGQEIRDLVVTIDPAATVGDLATYLADADPQRSVTGEGELTLAVVDQSFDQGCRVVDARLTLPESGLRSGLTVAVTARAEPVAEVGRAVATAVIVAGPDCGKEFPLCRGTAFIGRGHGTEIRLSDSSVSRRHAKLVVVGPSAFPEVADLGSANGIWVGGEEVPRAVLKTGDRVRLGDTELEVRLTERGRGRPDGGSASLAFTRSPRIAPCFEGRQFELPDLPERPKPARMPWLAMMLPAIMGVGIFGLTRSPYSLVFVLMSPMMMLGNHVEQHRGAKKDFERLMREFREDVEIVLAQIRASLEVEADQRRAENPSGAECIEAGRRLSPLLWTRRGDTPGFLQLRLGLGTLPSRSSLAMPKVGRSTAQAWSELAGLVEGVSVVPDVPVVVDPLRTGAIGVSGARSVALPVVRSLVLQAVSLHSPAELVVTAFASTTTARDWEWLKWVPHTSSPRSRISAAHLASSAPACSALLSQLEDLVETAGELRPDQEVGPDSSYPLVLVLVEDDAPVERGRLVQLAEKGWHQGICVVWLAPATSSLPAACRAFLEVEGTQGRAGYVREGRLVTSVLVDVVSLAETLAAARLLAPVEDSGAPVDDTGDLPRAVSLLTLTGTELAQCETAVLERWGESRSILTGPLAPVLPHRRAGNLRAIIGQSAQGTFSLDLRTDGPHALVGGTTGAGKSELLQAWILGMAAAHSPQRVTFLLVDYKGGSAFRDCVELPHTVGLVTDLSPHLVRRALASLSAELCHRERLLARYRAKDLVELEQRGEVDAPPSLVIVVDEFAALVQEVPEFVDGVVNVAQRGRSLGVHLILATQRPAGVIKDNLRANTNLRLGLRMADESDSTDVLGSAVAASFDLDLPGRAVSRCGPGRLTPFQTGYAGGWTSETPRPPQVRVETLGFALAQVWVPSVNAADPGASGGPPDLGPTDIQRLVSTIRVAARTAELPAPRAPWLPELRAVYDLACLPTTDGVGDGDDELVFGVADDPNNQAQPLVGFNPDKEGNLAVFGSSGSGKSALLRTIALAAGFSVCGGPCQVYGIDFGNRALSMLDPLPHVGSIVAGGDHERLSRLLTLLRETIDERAVRYSRASAATITGYRRLAEEPGESRIIVLVDGLTAFRAAYEMGGRARWLDLFTSLAADGRPVGVHFVISVDQRTGMPSTLAATVQSRVVLRMAHQDDYGFLGVAGDVLGMASPPGRGLLNGAEIQCAVLGGTSEVITQSRAVTAFAEAMRAAGVREAAPIRSLTHSVLITDLPAVVDRSPVIGVGSTSLSALPFEPRGSFVVTGPSGSGRTTTLASLARSLNRWDPAMTLHLLTPRRSSELAGLPDWAEVAAGTDDIVALAARLQAELYEGAHPRPMTVVVERVDDLAGTVAELPLSGLVKALLDQGCLVVTEGEPTFFSSSFGLPGLLKTSRSGLALQPDGVEGQTVFRSSFPAFNRASQPPGRGFLVQRGKPEMLQVAQASES